MTLSETPKSDSAETPSRALVRRDRSAAARRAARLNWAEREVRIISLFNRGVSIPEIAAREGLSLKMRNLIREILAKRMPRPPAEFLALPVSRLNEALLVSYSAMHTSVSGANFEAVDRVVTIVRELDRITDLRPMAGHRERRRLCGSRRRRRLRWRSKVRSRATRKWRRSH